MASTIHLVLFLFAFGCKFVTGQHDEELVFILPGFSEESGMKVGQSFFTESGQEEVTNLTNSETQTHRNLFQSAKSGNDSEFTLCLRFKAYFQRPEYVLASGFFQNKTSFIFGIDEVKKETFFKFSKSQDSVDIEKVTFDWIPRIDTWEFVCISKKPERGKKFHQLKFFVNGDPKGSASSVTADLNGITLFLLGQSDPPTSYEAFSGEIAHFYLWDKPIGRKFLKNLYKCENDPSKDQVVPGFFWREGVFQPLEVTDHKNLPTGLYLDQSEVCPKGRKPNEPYILPIYRSDEKSYHKEICEELGGEVPDLVNFGQNDTSKRITFMKDIYQSARFPRFADQNSNPALQLLSGLMSPKTPDSIQSCFVNDEFVTWMENSDSAPEPPLARGKKKSGLPIDPLTGKPIGFLPPGINVAFVGGAAKAKKDDSNVGCPFHVMSNGTAVEKCANDKTACSICLFNRRKPNLKLRGLCENSILKKHRAGEEGDGQEEFDTDYFAKNDKMSGQIVFRGRIGSRIRKKVEDLNGKASRKKFENSHGEWLLESLVNPYGSGSSAATRKIPNTKYPVGRHSWEMMSESCGDDELQLSFTKCKKNEFTCNSGKCVPIAYRCDYYDDCDEGEDEESCENLEIDEDNYKTQVAPRSLHKGVPWPVYISIDIVSFPEILAVEQRITVDFYLTLRWFDPRLEFKNLKLGKQENPINPATVDQLWIPRLGLLNGLSEFLTVVTEEDAEFFRGYIWRKRNPIPNDETSNTEDALYKGSLNPIVLTREYYQEFTCDFDLTWYPFDRQVCYMNFTVQGQTSKSLILREDSSNKEINYYGKKYLVEYRVEGQKLTVPRIPNGNFSTATVELVFQRRVVYHLLNIFLQSLLLVLTGYMSLFFHVNNFSDRVMVALTVMLVMASLQSSIQDSLPKTAYFKFIDWWILFSLNTQIGLMAFHTFLGWYTANEYRNYKENFMNSGRKVIAATIPKEVESNGGSSANIMTTSVISTSGSVDPDDIIGSDEYDYPKAKKLNIFCNIFFTISLTAFNVVYWSVAMGIYFS